MSRKVVPLSDGFFNDGYWYVLTSTSLGGSGLSPAEISEKLQVEREEHKRELLKDGVCLPLYFDGDCALDRAVVVVGDLSEAEEAEWVGRVRSHLQIPKGEFLVMGGGIEEDFETATSGEAPDPDDARHQVVPVEPGRYVVEVYAFLGSMTVNEHWGCDYRQEDEEGQYARPREIAAYWDATRPGQDRPEWVTQLLEEGDVGGEDTGLLEYVIRLHRSDEEVPLPELEDSTKWCGVFEVRRPAVCPAGIQRDSL
jgi:hypothetical protein